MTLRILPLLLTALLIGACTGEPKQTPQTPSETPVVTDPLAGPRARILAQLEAYYADLGRETIDETRYFAPVVQRFFNSRDLSREQVGQSLRNGFAQVEDRRIAIDPATLVVEQTATGYVADFRGTASSLKDGQRSEQPFHNRIAFDADYLMTAYESLATSADTRQVAPAATPANALPAATAVLDELKRGSFARTQQYIHPERGFYLLAHPGALPVPFHCASLDELFGHAEWMKSGMKSIMGQPRLDELPAFDCGDLFSKQGCFIAPKPAGYDGLSSIMQILNDTETSRFDTREIARAQEIERLAQVEVVDTGGELALYFGQIDGAWYLLIIDIGTYDCSA
ncbi:MAG: hypothetical protein OHK0039_10710 [Bacteroidia bacterium]